MTTCKASTITLEISLVHGDLFVNINSQCGAEADWNRQTARKKNSPSAVFHLLAVEQQAAAAAASNKSRKSQEGHPEHPAEILEI